MRHYVAVRDEQGKWFYANEGTNRRGETGWAPSGACRPWDVCPTCDPFGFRGAPIPSEGCETCAGSGRVDKAEPCLGHETAEAAYEHEKARILAHDVRFHEDRPNASSLHRCKASGCATFTSGSAEARPYKHWSLCAEHRTHDVVASLLRVGESWES